MTRKTQIVPEDTKGPTKKGKALGERAAKLREARGLTQEAAAKASGLLARTEISKLENGYLQARTTRQQEGLSRAYSVPFELIARYLEGRLELEELLTHGGPAGYARLGNLESALSYHGDRWAPPTVAAARAFAVEQTVDPTGPEWAALLDRVEKALTEVGLVSPQESEPASSRKS